MDLKTLAALAKAAGFEAICMRASQIGIATPVEEQERAAEIVKEEGLEVSMVSGDFPIVYNNEQAPACLRDITPYLDLAGRLGAGFIRVAIKSEEDIPFARAAADEAAARGIVLLHQCHIQSLFETIDQIEATLESIDRPNFGLIYEAANLEECGQDYGPDTIRRLAPWIKNVYLQNQRLNPNGAVTLETWCRGPVSFDLIDIPEPGGIDFASILKGLQAVDYSGWVTVHQSAPQSGSAEASARATARYLEELAG